MAVAVLDHVAIYASDPDRAADFYIAAFAMDDIPIHPPGTRWLGIGHGITLHIIGGCTESFSLPRMVHLSLRTDDLADTIAHLDRQNHPWCDYTGRPRSMQLRFDGIRQIYVQDPDGYWVEISDARGTPHEPSRPPQRP